MKLRKFSIGLATAAMSLFLITAPVIGNAQSMNHDANSTMQINKSDHRSMKAHNKMNDEHHENKNHCKSMKNKKNHMDMNNNKHEHMNRN